MNGHIHRQGEIVRWIVWKNWTDEKSQVGWWDGVHGLLEVGRRVELEGKGVIESEFVRIYEAVHG